MEGTGLHVHFTQRRKEKRVLCPGALPCIVAIPAYSTHRKAGKGRKAVLSRLAVRTTA
jgi:hypothetical protein